MAFRGTVGVYRVLCNSERGVWEAREHNGNNNAAVYGGTNAFVALAFST